MPYKAACKYISALKVKSDVTLTSLDTAGIANRSAAWRPFLAWKKAATLLAAAVPTGGESNGYEGGGWAELWYGLGSRPVAGSCEVG
jgi:hypothetical protein